MRSLYKFLIYGKSTYFNEYKTFYLWYSFNKKEYF